VQPACHGVADYKPVADRTDLWDRGARCRRWRLRHNLRRRNAFPSAVRRRLFAFASTLNAAEKIAPDRPLEESAIVVTTVIVSGFGVRDSGLVPTGIREAHKLGFVESGAQTRRPLCVIRQMTMASVVCFRR
jgi:hypothetical protein